MKSGPPNPAYRLAAYFGVMLFAISAMVWGINSEGVRWVSAALAVCVLTLQVRLWNLEERLQKLLEELEAKSGNERESRNSATAVKP